MLMTNNKILQNYFKDSKIRNKSTINKETKMFYWKWRNLFKVKVVV